MQVGIVGFPYSGKTTFFQTLSEIHIDPQSLQKKDSNQAVVKIPDKRLDYFTETFIPKKKVNATIDIVDVAGVQKNESGRFTFSSNFLTKIKTNDALIHVVRGFEDDAFPHVEGKIDMMRDIRVLEEELILNDLAFVENRFEKLEREMQKQKNKDLAIKEKEEMERWQDCLSNEKPLRELDFTNEEWKLVKNYQPLSAKPLLIALNLDENDISNKDEILKNIKSAINWKNTCVEPFFAKIEMELSQLPEEEKEVFMQEYGFTDSALNRLINAAYSLLGMQSFFTVGEDECRAWTIKKGMTAQEAAGVIHTDFFNKFIRAEVVHYKDFKECGTFAKCKEKGHFWLEGKEYVVHDGDILHVRHG